MGILGGVVTRVAADISSVAGTLGQKKTNGYVSMTKSSWA